MPSSKRFLQAYQQAPWRQQTQRGAVLLLIAVLGATVVWVMLSVTVQASTIGMEIQSMERDRDAVMRSIAHLRTQYADLTSASRMTQRAADLGFEPLQPSSITYMVVPGYTGRATQIDSIAQPYQLETGRLVKSAYTQSLWEWMVLGALNNVDTLNRGMTP